MERILAKKKMVAGIVLLLLLAVAGIVGFQMWDSGSREDKQEAYRSLSDVDKEAADLYAEWYECSPEDVAVIQSKTKDWDKTAEKLEQDFFTIPENTK